MTQHPRSSRRVAIRPALTFLSAALLFVACGDNPYPTPSPDPTTTVTGRVTNSADHTPIAGATVRIGNAVDTTGADGGFELTGVATGSVMLRCTAPGYEDFALGIIVTATAVTQDIALNRDTRFDGDGFALYVPAHVDTVHALLVVLGGGDTRWIASGVQTDQVPSSLWHLGQSLRNLPSARGLAILGTSRSAMSNDSLSDNLLLNAVRAVASTSGHPELATVPVILYGLSTGGAEASGFAARNPEQVAGVFLNGPLGVSALTSGKALGVPTFVAVGALDTAVNVAALTSVFEGNRAAGALWAFAREAAVAKHEISLAQHLFTVDWITTILTLRLPANRSDALREVAETSGWLGNRATGQAAPWTSYVGDRGVASWLPSQTIAEGWEGLMARRRTEIFELGDFALYVPAGVPLVRGVIVALGGPDTRGFATGQRIGAPIAEVEASLQLLGQGFRTLASTHGLAIVGTSRGAMANASANDTLLFSTLERFAIKSGRPEIGYPYFLMYGMSGGAPEASGFTARNPYWVAGLFLKVPSGVSPVSGRALEVPTYVVLAELDAFVNNAALTTTFEGNRGAGALWALAIEPGVPHHSLSSHQRQVTLNWIDTILEHQLPYEPGWDPLHGFLPTSGWLGNRATGRAAPWATYAGDRGLASWLPSQSTATEWETLVAPVSVP